MAFQQGLSGLNASSRALDVTSNNIANASTVGFKSSYTIFADMYASAMTGQSARTQIGIGVAINAVNQSFVQGNLTVTNNPLDIAINGQGFFRMQQFDGSISYSRNGQFDLDKNGFITDAYGNFLTGFDVIMQDAGRSVFAGTASPLQVDTTNMPPQATQDGLGIGATGAGATVAVNLDSRNEVIDPAVTPFDPLNVASYHDSTSMEVFDSLGNRHVMAIYFVRRDVAAPTPAPPATASTWDVYTQIDGEVPDTASYPFQLMYDANGRPTDGTTPTPPYPTILMPVSFDLDGLTVPPGAVSPLEFSIDVTNTTQFGTGFSIYKLTQVGYTTGELAGLSVTKTGVVQGRYTNGLTWDIGQLALASFPSNQGLTSLGNNQWAESAESGQPIVGTPGSGVLGRVSSGEIEESNVDLTQELVNMIIEQRNYQANAQSIRTQDQILQTLVNLR
ncbi:flagellar hook protein FlgE [Betaproteobacteria bacterium]|nr:flagellar hook protein FlgE [Betaproteobacteria bacterium]GHU10368.1 flagellar hook protein FlgE [Betaproteobacteria bacterium]GHU29502.1 flagellar hook protein FlgE [Betaproteobacteria bacterium]